MKENTNKNEDVKVINEHRIKFLSVGIVVLCSFVFYVSNSTQSGLWYDEAVEYFYSKYLTGTVPGGFGTENMFERIRYTYQPPLYNVLMFIWLSITDSEFTYRLAGILITIIGSLGCYMAIEEVLPKGNWGIIGMLFYLYAPGVVYYGLECAEYNLMLCFIAWMMFFYIRILVRNDWKSLVCFFVFACLSVYSQYGSVFVVIGLYASILIFFVLNNKFVRLKQMINASVVTLVVAVLPLVAFFVIPQMKRQNDFSISHEPFFTRGLLMDFFMGGKNVLSFLFGSIAVIGIIVLIIACCLSLFLCPTIMSYPLIASVITWLLYFITVSCSYYGYNSWNSSSIGTMNIGGRYSLFFIPCIVVVLIVGLGLTSSMLKNTKYYKCILLVTILSLTIYCAKEVYEVSVKGWVKDDIREVSSAWYECEGYREKTLVHQWDDALFNYYLIHDNRYDKAYLDMIEVADIWIRSAEYSEMREGLLKMGFLSLKEYYYVTPGSGSYDVFLSVVADAGYSVKQIYNGNSHLLYLVKD